MNKPPLLSPTPLCRHAAVSLAAGLLALTAGGCQTPKDSAHPAFPGSMRTDAAQREADLRDRGPGIEKYYKIRVPSAVRLAPNGDLYCRDWPDGVNQLYRVRPSAGQPATAKAGQSMERLTDFADGCTAYALNHEGTKLLVMTARGGNENAQVYVLDHTNPDPKTNLTPALLDPKVMFRVNHWMPNAQGFYYTANQDDPKNFHIYRYDFKPGTKDASGNPVAGTSTRLASKEGDWTVADATLDGSKLLVTQYRSSSDADVHVLDTKTGAMTFLNAALKLPAGQTASLEPVGFGPGEKSVFVTSDHEGGLRRLFAIDLATMTLSKPLPALDAFELDGASLNDARTLLAVAVNEDGFGVPYLYRVPSMEQIALPAIEKGVVSLTELDDNRVSWTLSNARTPGLMSTWTLPAPGQTPAAPRPVTIADNQGIDLAQNSLPQLVKFKSFDGMEIPAFVYLPAGAKAGRPVPFVVDYHGGPEGQERPGFNARVQYLVSEGFGVMQPNVRGSAGYGRAFLMADDYKLRWNAVKDGWHAAKWLVDNGWARAGKIASYGGSYGGFMTTAVNVEDQNMLDSKASSQRLFGACVDVVGVINLKTFLERTADYRRKLREVEYGPLTDPEFLDSVSPLVHADKINVPVLVAHGANDPRVPVTEAMQLAEALQRRGYDPEQIYFDDEGHGFAKLENRLLFAQRMSRFFKRHIGF